MNALKTAPRKAPPIGVTEAGDFVVISASLASQILQELQRLKDLLD
jgi:hypothetical protein